MTPNEQYVATVDKLLKKHFSINAVDANMDEAEAERNIEADIRAYEFVNAHAEENDLVRMEFGVDAFSPIDVADEAVAVKEVLEQASPRLKP